MVKKEQPVFDLLYFILQKMVWEPLCETSLPDSDRHSISICCLFQDTESRNLTLEAQLSDLEQRLESSQQEREAFRKSLHSLLELLDSKIFELTELRDTLAKLLEST